MEKGKVEKPYRPTLRAMLPIKHNGEFGGILIINYLMDDFLNKLTNTPLYDMILCDDKGFTLFHYEDSKKWGFYQKPQFNITQEFADQSKDILSKQLVVSDDFVSRKLDLPVHGGLNLILQLKNSYLESQIQQTKTQYMTTSILIFSFSIFLSFIIVKLFSNTLFNLKKVENLYQDLNKLTLRNSVALKASEVGIWEWDYETNTLTWDKQMYNIYGIQKTDKNPYTMWSDAVDKDDLPKVEENINNAKNNNSEYNISFWITTPKGEKKYIKALGINEYDKDGKAIRMVGTNQNITIHKMNKMLLEEQNKELESIFNTALEGIAVLNLDTKYLYFNKKYTQMLGYAGDELKEKYCLDLTDESFIEESKEIYAKVREKGFYENFERLCKTKDGKLKRLKSSIALMPNKKEYLMTTVDNTELYEAMELIKKQSVTDKLTQLYNRIKLDEVLENELNRFKRYKTIFSIIMVDIDFFKSVNDTYGHNVGDKVLIEISNILLEHTRKTDIVGRWGGEEFLIICTQSDINGAIALAEGLRAKVDEFDFSVVHHKTISLGISEVRADDNIESLVKRADDNLYKAKKTGKNKVVSGIV
ncbi:MAG: diguanylate cyclase [Campylobacterales bacterium]|nr:diguanylate cyclase [Campylobacterales bacterium]